MPLGAAMGDCYAWAAKFCVGKQGCVVRHGTVEHPWSHKRYAHAWAEYRGSAWDYQTDTMGRQPMPLAEFDAQYHPQVEATYAGGHAFRQGMKAGHWGPFHGLGGGPFGEPIPSSIRSLIPSFVAAAQRVYDDWVQDENDDLCGGGVCDLVAEEIAALLPDAATVNSEGMGENHTWVVAKLPEGVYMIDIPPQVYETGGGYCWSKRPGVVFTSSDVVVDQLDSDPNEFENYLPA